MAEWKRYFPDLLDGDGETHGYTARIPLEGDLEPL